MIDPSALLGLAGVPVTTALTELLKRAFPELPARFVPLVALFFSLAINLGLGARLGVDVTTSLVMGLVAGLAASGLYSAGKELRVTVLGAHLDNLDEPADSSYRKLVLMRARVVGTMWTDGTRHRRPVYDRLRDELDDPLFHVRVGPSARCTADHWLRLADAALAELPPGARARVRALNEVNLAAEGAWSPEQYADFLISVRAAWPPEIPLVAAPLCLADPAWPTWWSRFLSACGGAVPADRTAVNCYAHLVDEAIGFPRPFDATELNTLAVPAGPTRAAWLLDAARRLGAETTQVFIAGGRSYGAWDERYVLTEEEAAAIGAAAG